MKKLLLSISLLFILNALSHAQYWSEQNSGVSVSLNSVTSVNGYAWVCGNNGTVLRTTNGGSNWINAGGNGYLSSVNLTTIYCESDLIAMTAGNNVSMAYAYRTTNGGTNWVQVFSQIGGNINAIYLSATDNSFLVGNPVAGRWSLWKSTNNGVNWDSTGLYIPAGNNESGFANSLLKIVNFIWFGTNNSKVYYSSDNGVNWSAQSILPEVNSRAVWFLPSPNYLSTIYGLTGGNSLMKTTNSGSSWFQVLVPSTYDIKGITGSLTDSRSWFVRGSTIYTSFNQGANWSLDYTAPAGTFNHISIIRDSPTRVWAVRSNGGISKYPGMSTVIKQIENRIPGEFKLYQNYPNPFNPNTRIRFDIPSVETIHELSLRIYDILGKEIATLADEQLGPGTYEVEWNGSNFASGMYFARLEAGSFIDIKKMVLLK
jgi:photosystem II stability/assembly factor-like uncharacterized protein